MIEVKYKKLVPEAKDPVKAHFDDIGFDLTAITKTETEEYVQYGTGIALDIPRGYYVEIVARSSVSKYDLILANGVGTVDQGYKGELFLRFKRIGNGNKIYVIGEKIGQIKVLPYPEVYMTCVKELSTSERGTGGFGSTDHVHNIGLITPIVEPNQLAFHFQDSISKGDPPTSYGYVKTTVSSVNPELNLASYHTSVNVQGDYLRTIKEQQVNAI